MTIDIKPIMTPERILGALIWEVMHDRLGDDLIDLVDTLPEKYPEKLEGDLDNLVKATWGANMDPVVRDALINFLQGEIESTLHNLDPDN